MQKWFILMALGGASPVFAAEIEVSPGDDIRTLTGSLGAGSVIVFKEGTYVIENELNWTGIGTAEEPIVLRAASSNRPVIQLTGGSRVAFIHDASHITVEGLIFEGSPEHYEAAGFNGIRIDNSDNITIRNCEIRQTSSSAVYLYGNNEAIDFSRNHIYNTRDGNGVYVGCGDASCWTFDSEFVNNWIHDTGGTNNSGLVIAPGGYNNQVVDNVVYNTQRHGITTSSTEFSAQNIVEGNVVWGTEQHGFVINGAAIVRNNIAFNVLGSAFYSDNSREALENLVVSSNTFADSAGYAVRLRNWDGAMGMVFANNAVTNPVGYALRVDEAATDEAIYYSGNVITGLVNGLEVDDGGFTMGGGIGDYLDWENWDFYPSRTSRLVDAGDPLSEAWVPPLDFNGQNRDGSAPDAGAFEWVSESNPGWAVKEGFKEEEGSNLDGSNQVGGCCDKEKTAKDSWILLLPLAALGWVRRRKH